MYKYKQTTDVEVGDLVIWTKLLPNNPYITKNKVYQVIDKKDINLVTVTSVPVVTTKFKKPKEEK